MKYEQKCPFHAESLSCQRSCPAGQGLNPNFEVIVLDGRASVSLVLQVAPAKKITLSILCGDTVLDIGENNETMNTTLRISQSS